jgi:ferredoxin
MAIKLEIHDGESVKTVEVEKGARLINAIEAAGVDILHRCGGPARCTTCRVSFASGEPRSITEAERDKLAEKGDEGVGIRLACQIQCNQDMAVKALMTVRSSGLSDPGGAPEAHITPDPVWI